MVNGKTLEDELHYIDDFFDSMDSKEFEEMLIECGANEIKGSCSNCTDTKDVFD